MNTYEIFGRCIRGLKVTSKLLLTFRANKLTIGELSGLKVDFMEVTHFRILRSTSKNKCFGY